MFNVKSGAYNFIESITFTYEYSENYNEKEIQGYLTVSFLEGEGLPNM
jgi:hypothetical protein